MRNFIQNAICFFLFIFLFSSCSVKEEMWLQEDGSGKLVYTLDMGKAMGMMDMMMQSEEGSTGDDNPMDMFKNMPEGQTKMDSIINFYDIMPDSIKRNVENPKDLENLNMIMSADKETQSFNMGISAEFESFAQLDKMFLTLAQAKEGGNDQDPMNSMLAGLSNQNYVENYSMDSKQFVRKEMENTDALGDMGSEEMDMDEMAGMAEMFGKMEMVSVYHFPYKVKSVEGADAEIDGNTVTIRGDLMEMAKMKTIPELKVNFKRKKFLGIF